MVYLMVYLWYIQPLSMGFLPSFRILCVIPSTIEGGLALLCWGMGSSIQNHSNKPWKNPQINHIRDSFMKYRKHKSVPNGELETTQVNFYQKGILFHSNHDSPIQMGKIPGISNIYPRFIHGFLLVYTITGWCPPVISWSITPSEHNHKYHTLLIL